MKMIVHNSGLLTPAHHFINKIEQIEDVVLDLTFPLIVKHYNGYGSVGMTKNSRVTNQN